jgi:hypothetical protein
VLEGLVLPGSEKLDVKDADAVRREGWSSSSGTQQTVAAAAAAAGSTNSNMGGMASAATCAAGGDLCGRAFLYCDPLCGT